MAAHILDAQGAYRFPTDSGHCYLVYRKVEETSDGNMATLYGAMRGTGSAAAGVDLTEPTGEVWDAESASQV